MPISNYDKYVLLAPFNEPDESLSPVDYSPLNQTFTLIGNAKIDNALGFSALTLDGSGDGLRSNKCTRIGTGDYFFRARIRPAATSGTMIIWDRRNSIAGNTTHPVLYLASGVLKYFVNADVISGATLSAGTEYYVELSRVSGISRLFINGTQTGSNYTDSNSFTASEDHVGIDRGESTSSFNGTIRDMEAAVGIGGNTATYTPPGANLLTKTISNSAAVNKILDDAGNPAIRTVRAYPYDWPVRAFQTDSDSSGNFSMQVPDLASGYLMACMDDAAGTVYNSLVHSKVVPG